MCDQVEAHLSRALSVPMVRRHSRGNVDSQDGFHYGPAVRIVSGNYVTGRRRGVVDGVDFGATGSGMASISYATVFKPYLNHPKPLINPNPYTSNPK